MKENEACALDDRLYDAIVAFEEQKDKLDARYHIGKKHGLTDHLMKTMPELSSHTALLEAAKDALEDVTGPITSSGIRIRFSTREKLETAIALTEKDQPS